MTLPTAPMDMLAKVERGAEVKSRVVEASVVVRASAPVEAGLMRERKEALVTPGTKAAAPAPLMVMLGPVPPMAVTAANWMAPPLMVVLPV